MNFVTDSETGGADLRTIADHLPSPIFYCDADLIYRYVNPAGARLHGRTFDDIVGSHVSNVMVPGQIRILKPRHDAVLRGETLHFEETRTFGGGEHRRLQTDYIPDVDAAGQVGGFFVMLTDVTERYKAAIAAEELTRQLQTISDAVPAQICFLDRDRRYIWVNRTTAKWFATDVESIIGRTTEEIYGSAFVEETQSHVDRVLAGEEVDYEAIYLFPDGVERTVDVSCKPNIRADGVIDGYILLAHDVSDYRDAANKLEVLATTDALTGVANRRRFLDVCEEEAKRARRYGRPLSVIMCDIDHFKSINDSFGHAGGDIVLKKFALLVSNMLRKSVDTVGRLGGEEFALVLPETGGEKAESVAERIRIACQKMRTGMPDGAAQVTCSFGVAQLRDDEDVTGLLTRADKVLYRAKETGRNRVCGERSEEPVSVAAVRAGSESR